MLTIAPAPRADKEWLAPHAAYSASKIAMAFVSRRLHRELFEDNVACNTLWPRYATATAATVFIGGERLISMSRTPASVADAAFRIVTAPSRLVRNKHFVDQDVLRAVGVDDFKPYNVDPDVVEPVDDFFLFSSERGVSSYSKPPPRDSGSGDVVLRVPKSAEEERREKERRDVVLVLVDARDVKAYVALFSALFADRPNRKLVVAAHEDAAPAAPVSRDAFTENLRLENDLATSEDTRKTLFRDDRFRVFVGDMRVAAGRTERPERGARPERGDRPERGGFGGRERGDRGGFGGRGGAGGRGGGMRGVMQLMRGDSKVSDMSKEQIEQLKEGVAGAEGMIDRMREMMGDEVADKLTKATGDLKKALEAGKMEDADKALNALKEAFPMGRGRGGRGGRGGEEGGRRRGRGGEEGGEGGRGQQGRGRQGRGGEGRQGGGGF